MGGGGFNNPVVGGDGELVRVRLRSENYVQGVSGWNIARNGDAEFNNAVFRGDIVVGGSTPPNLELTETIPAELSTFYGVTWAGIIASFVIKMNVNSNTYNYEVLLSSSSVGPARAVGQVIAGNVREHRLEYTAGTVAVTDYGEFTDSRVRMFGENLLGDPSTPGSDMLWGNLSLPRSVIDVEQITGTSSTPAAVGEVLMMSSLNMTFVAGRAHQVELFAGIVSAAVQNPVVQIRKNNLAGALLIGGRFPITVTGIDLPLYKFGIILNTTAADITAKLALTCNPQVATIVTIRGSAGTANALWRITDIGDAGSYIGFPSV